VAELAGEKHQGPLAFTCDAVHEFLDHHADAAAEFVEQLLR